MSTILKVDDINVYYGSIHAIKGISFEVNEGEIVTLIGANGAGKSTTLNTISGLLHSKTGHIEFMGEPLNHVPSHKVVSKGLALVPEGRRIFLQMSVQENLDMGAFSRRGGNIDADMERVFEQFPRLKERRKQVAGTLSGGEQQMLAMGRALMSNPKLLMLDEPSMGLAPILVEQIFDIIKNLHKAGTTILLVEQNAQAALSVADRGYVLETGKIVTTGTGAHRHGGHRRGASGERRHQEGVSGRLNVGAKFVHSVST
jgi:branched-chain amino acid transport system ATP-binding protein